MNKFITLISFCLVLIFSHQAFAQTVFINEDFEGGSLPSDWLQQSLASDGGFQFGTAASIASQFWAVPDNGSSIIAATNDDDCNCDKSADYLVMPMLDFTNSTTIAMQADIFFLGLTYGETEQAFIEVSLNGGTTWNQLEELSGEAGWTTRFFDLSAYAGMDNVLVAFRYTDNGGWLYGIAVDQVSVFEPLSLDVEMAGLSSKTFGETDSPFAIKGKGVNKGAAMITSLDITYLIDGANPQTATLNNLNIQPFADFEFEYPNPWIPTEAGNFNLSVRFDAVNGSIDGDDQNNEMDMDVEIYPLVIRPNIIDFYGVGDPIFTEIGNGADLLDKPTDLDFFPILGKYELWVINERVENSGGSTVTYYDAGKTEQISEQRVDGNAWHFMSLPTGMAFSSDNGNWASSTGVLDANHNGGTFTGPTLWSSDPDIYAQPSGGNGSHLDMLHGSPYSMGIAHEVDNAFWVFDGYNNQIVRYDFKEDHGPGNDDHADGEVLRLTEISIQRDSPVPSHLVLDKTSGWLYVVDNGNDRVLRLDINSGMIGTSLPLINEQLAVHASVINVNWEVIVDSGLDRPSGIEVFENRLMVSDYGTGDIIIYDMDNDFAELNRIQTEPGITGLVLGPEGNIWYTNRLTNKIMQVAPSDISSTTGINVFPVSISPNPTDGLVQINVPETLEGEISYRLTNATGQEIRAGILRSNFETLDFSAFQNGLYFISIFNDNNATTKKIVLTR